MFRAKEKLKREQVSIVFPEPAVINERLNVVLTTLYLLFSEGYYSESNDSVLRKDLCLEAMRLNYQLIENTATNQPPVNALMALMCFHASRFEARKEVNGELLLYDEQDETLWDRALISKGAYFLQQASQGTVISRYHLEAGIAYWHTIKTDCKEKWEAILQLFDQLLQVEYSPVAALNRTYVLSKLNGKQAAIDEAVKLNLTGNHYYHTLLGHLYSGIDPVKANDCFQQALVLAKTAVDKKTIERRLDELQADNRTL